MLRPIDQLEAEALSGLPAYVVIEQSITNSDRAQLICGDLGEPHYLWGVSKSPHEPTVGMPWMLATTSATFPREFLPKSRDIVAWMQSRYDVLWNLVHVDNHKARRWLERLGFTFPKNKRHLFNNEPFMEFMRTAPYVR